MCHNSLGPMVPTPYVPFSGRNEREISWNIAGWLCLSANLCGDKVHTNLNLWMFMLGQAHADRAAMHHRHLSGDDAILRRWLPSLGFAGINHVVILSPENVRNLSLLTEC